MRGRKREGEGGREKEGRGGYKGVHGAGGKETVSGR